MGKSICKNNKTNFAKKIEKIPTIMSTNKLFTIYDEKSENINWLCTFYSR